MDKGQILYGMDLGAPSAEPGDEDGETKELERALKAPSWRGPLFRWSFMAASLGVIFIGWIMFGMGVNWGVHGSVVAGSTGE